MVGLPFSHWDTWYAVALNLAALAVAVAAVVLLVRARRQWYAHDKAAWWAAVLVLVLLNGITIGGVPVPFATFTVLWMLREERNWARQEHQWAEQGL